MTAGTVTLAFDGHIATITLANPERRNAMSVVMWRELAERVKAVAERPATRAVLVRGAGDKAFCAGADISDFDTARTGPANAKSYDDLVESTCRLIETIRCPTIALVHGACMGAGVSVAASCDLRIVSDGAVFAIPASRLGLGYDPRGVARFLRVYGPAATRVLLLSAGRLNAERAFQLGAAAVLGTVETAQAEAARMLAAIADGAPMTIAAAKAALRAHALGGDDLMSEAIRLYEAADASEDYQEGRRAFAEKRAPRFAGK